MSAKKKTTIKPEVKKAPAAKKAVAKKTPAKKAAVKKTPTKKAASKSKLSAEERYQRIQFEAYLMAEKNAFAGDASEYWSKAEKIVDARFA
jgi:hypothetical protein